MRPSIARVRPSKVVAGSTFVDVADSEADAVDGEVGVRELLFLLLYTQHPTPYTLHLTPYTLRLASYTLHPTPHTLRPTPYTLRLTPVTLHPTPHTLNPTP